MTNKNFDFLFSFAGEDRKEVEEIKIELSKKYKIFYDQDMQSELLGKDLYRYLRNRYKFEGKYVVCFLSKSYYKKEWTNLEFSAIKERLMMTFFSSNFLIPILLDDTPITEDIPHFIGYYKHENTQKTCQYLNNKYECSLQDDFYIDNLENFINFFTHNLEKELEKWNADCITLNNGIKFLYKEYFLDIPSVIPTTSIGLYKKKNGIRSFIPDILITWNPIGPIHFSINYFSKVHKQIKEYTFEETIKLIADYIIQDSRR